MANEKTSLLKVVEDLKASTDELVEKYRFHSQQALTDMMAGMLRAGLSSEQAVEIAKEGSKRLITGMAVVSTLHAEAVLHVAAELIPDARLKGEFTELIEQMGVDLLSSAAKVELDDSAQ